MAKSIPTFKLNTKLLIPAIGYGTGTKWAIGKRQGSVQGLDENVVSAVQTALTSSGFNFIDGAEFYNTEAEIGQAIKASGIARSDLFITTKVYLNIRNAAQALATSLTKLGLDYVDLYLIHTPFLTKEKNGIELEDAWKEMEKLYKLGKAKSIGVSNFSVDNLERIAAVSTIIPAVNQIEFNPYLQNQTPGIYKYAQEKGILLQAYSPLGPLTVNENEVDASGGRPQLAPVLDRLAKHYNKSKAQILLRWVYQNNVSPITTSAHSARQKEALDIFDFELEKEHLELISDVGAKFTKRKFMVDQYKTANLRL